VLGLTASTAATHTQSELTYLTRTLGYKLMASTVENFMEPFSAANDHCSLPDFLRLHIKHALLVFVIKHSAEHSAVQDFCRTNHKRMREDESSLAVLR